MALKSLKVAFIEADTGKELVTIQPSNSDWLDATGEELSVKGLYTIERLGKRFIKERIGYSGAVKVKVVC